MKGNPYTSETFQRIWVKHYCKGNDTYTFNFFKGMKFAKSKFWPVYVNLGKNFTNGLDYELDTNATDFKGKVALIYDIPSYFDVSVPEDSPITCSEVKQYEALYGDLSKHNSIDDVLAANFNSSKSRYNFRRSLKQLDDAVNLNTTFYYGAIEKETYALLMTSFKALLNKRFDDKNVFNTVLPMWDFFTDLIYEMILEKRVVMNVMYNDQEPIAMSINFVSDETVFVAIRTFDIEYHKLNIGNIEIYKLLEWCLENQIKIVDFSKGESYYKKRWTDTKYHYYHHILYDRKSLISTIVGRTLISFFKFKQYLRDKEVNTWVVKLKQVKKKMLRQD